jgi:hypothetical protein
VHVSCLSRACTYTTMVVLNQVMLLDMVRQSTWTTYVQLLKLTNFLPALNIRVLQQLTYACVLQ